MTVKESILSTGISGSVYSAEDFIRHARPAIFGALNDSQKHVFIRLSPGEQRIYVVAILKDMGIRIPDGREFE